MQLSLKEKTAHLNILYVEDDFELRQRVADFLKMLFRDVYLSIDGKDALEMLQTRKIDIVITDIDMPRVDGIELTKTIRKNKPNLPIIVLSGCDDRAYLLEAIPLGIARYLIKPFDKDGLLLAIRECVEKIESDSFFEFCLPYEARYKYSAKTVVLKGEEIPLTPPEVSLIELLIAKKGKVVSFDEIEEVVFFGKDMTESSLKNLLLRVRKKLGENSIKSVRSMGLIIE